MKSIRHLSGLNALLERRQVTKRSSPGERVIASIFPSRGSGYPGFWFSDRIQQVYHYRNWTYVCIDLIARKKASVTANLCYKTDRPVRGATVKACQRALMNLMGGGLGADPYVGQRVTLKSSVADPRTTTAYGNYVGMDGWDRPTVYDAKSGRLVQDGNPTPAVGFSGGGHSWLTMGEWRSKALSVVKPHDNLMPLEHDHPYRRLCENPNPIDTPFDIAYERRMFRGLCGIAYEWTPKNAYGKPCERWVIPSHWVYPRTGAGQYVPFNHEHADELVWDYEIRPWGYPGYAGVLHFPPDEVIVYRDKHPLSKIDGWSKLAAGAQVIDLEEAITQRQWSQLINLGVPGMVVKAPPGYEDWDDNDMARVEAKFWNRIQGAFQHGQSLMVPNGAEVEPWGYNPTEMAFQAAEDQARDRILSLHGVPKAAVGLSESQTYGSVMAMLGTIHSLVVNPELTADGQTETKHLASQFNERAPAFSTMTGGGHGATASAREVVSFYDDTVPADPQQVNADLALDLQANAVSPNEIRALRGRQPFRRGGDNPIVNGPGGPMPLEINTEERHIDDMVDILAKITSAEGKQTGEQQTESDQASDEARVDSADVRAEATEGQPLADDHGPTGLEPPEKPNGKPSKSVMKGDAQPGEFVVNGYPVFQGFKQRWYVVNEKDTRKTKGFKTREEAVAYANSLPHGGRTEPRKQAKALDRLGGEESNVDPQQLAAADFVTLPKDVQGTNCENCKYNDDGVCQHPKIDGQPVNDRNCCLLPGALVAGVFVAGSKARYSGEAVRITTMSGSVISLTVNHPVLTEHGFVAAGQISDGDELIGYRSWEDALSTPDNVHNQPSIVEEVFESLLSCWSDTAREESAGPFDFHSDGQFIKGDVQVVRANGLLRSTTNTYASQCIDNRGFSNPDLGKRPLSSGSGQQRRFVTTRTVSGRIVSGLDLALPLLNGHRIPSILGGDRSGGRTLASFIGSEVGVPLGERRNCLLYSAAKDNASIDEVPSEDSVVGVVESSNLPQTFPGQVKLDQVVEVVRFHYDGPVYDLETDTGFIIAEGILISNCAYWDNEETLRTWREEKSLGDRWVHPSIRKQVGGNPSAELVRAFPDVRQDNHWRCGAACFAAVCQHYGVEMTVDEASKVLGTNVQHSTDPAAIIRELRKRDIAARPRKGMTVEQLARCTDAGNPVVVCLQDYGDRREAGASFAYGHYMVALEASHGVVIFQDPSIENVEREPGGDVPRSERDPSGNVALRGRVVVDAAEFDAAWHDQRANGEKLVRFGIVCGPRQTAIGKVAKAMPKIVIFPHPSVPDQWISTVEVRGRVYWSSWADKPTESQVAQSWRDNRDNFDPYHGQYGYKDGERSLGNPDLTTPATGRRTAPRDYMV